MLLVELGTEIGVARQAQQRLVYPFKNGTEVKPEEVPEKLRYMCTADKNDIKVQRKDEFFIRIKGNDKLLGPIGQFDSYIISSDGKNYAFPRGQDDYVVVNGKPVTKGGFNIGYNANLKAFHWFMQEGQKVYLYTHKLTASTSTTPKPAPKTAPKK
jgi:hypothetical protein